MIYSVYWRTAGKKSRGSLYGRRDLDYPAALAHIIREKDQDYFLFIITKPQKESFDEWLDEHKLWDHVAFYQKRGSTNKGHFEHRNCHFIVMASPNHWYRKLGENDPPITQRNFINYVNWPEGDQDESET